MQAGPWTPEAVIEHPDAVMQLHREFTRSGADVLQSFTFYATDDKLENRGHSRDISEHSEQTFSSKQINEEAVKLARTVANETGGLVLGGFSQTPSYLSGAGKQATQEQFRVQAAAFKEQGVDFLLAECTHS
jgi:betaine-homocysteine S-methyltransferase